MKRYVTIAARPRGYYDHAVATDSLARVVYERDDEPQATGLLDARGNALWRINETNVIGYVRFPYDPPTKEQA